jgi:hypothetical protein
MRFGGGRQSSISSRPCSPRSTGLVVARLTAIRAPIGRGASIAEQAQQSDATSLGQKCNALTAVFLERSDAKQGELLFPY